MEAQTSGAPAPRSVNTVKSIASRLSPVASLLCFVALVVLVAGCSAEAKRARYMRRADAYFDKGQYIKAEIEYRNAGRLSKTLDPHLVTRLATIYYDEGRGLEAFPLLTNAVSLQSDDPELRYKLGMTYMGLRDTTNARNAALFVLDKEPSHQEAILLLADSAVKPDEIAAARQKLNALRAKGDSWAAHIALAELAFREKETNVAQAEVDAAAKLDPKAPAVNIARAKLASMHNQRQQAEDFLRQAAEASPLRSSRRLLYVETKGTNIAEAKSLLDKWLKDAPDYVPAWAMRGRIALREKDYDECTRIAKTVLSWDPLSYDIRLLLARTLVLQQQTARALDEFDRLLTLHPRLPELHYETAVAQVQNGNLSEAIKHLDDALRVYPDFTDAVILRAELKMRTGAAEDAISSLITFLKAHPENNAAYLALAEAYRVQARWDDALAIYQAFIRNAPTVPEFQFAAGAVLLQEKKANQARPYFEEALRLSPTYTSAAEQLIDIDIQDKDFVSAQRRVDQQIKATTNAPGALILQAKLFIATGNSIGAEEVLNRVIKGAPDATFAYSILAQVYLKNREPNKAVVELQAAADRNPKDIGSRYLLGTIYRDSLGDNTRAKKWYNAVLEINPKMVGALNDMAYLLAEKMDQPDQAISYATKAHDLAPNDFSVSDTLGWIFYRKGDIPRALTLLADAIQKAPETLDSRTQAEIRYHLAMAYYMGGDQVLARSAFSSVMQLDQQFAQESGVPKRIAVLDIDPSQPNALSSLEAAIKENDRDFVALVKIGQAYEHTGATEKARMAYERAARVNPNAAQPQLLLALLTGDTLKDFSKSVEYARSARKLAPNDPEIADILGRASLRVNDYPTAFAALQEYSRSAKAGPDAQYYLAVASYGIG